jgi:hypothetical protein
VRRREGEGDQLGTGSGFGWRLNELGCGIGFWLLCMIYDNANAIMRFWVSLDPVYSCPICTPT